MVKVDVWKGYHSSPVATAVSTLACLAQSFRIDFSEGLSLLMEEERERVGVSRSTRNTARVCHLFNFLFFSNWLWGIELLLFCGVDVFHYRSLRMNRPLKIDGNRFPSLHIAWTSAFHFSLLLWFFSPILWLFSFLRIMYLYLYYLFRLVYFYFIFFLLNDCSIRISFNVFACLFIFVV